MIEPLISGERLSHPLFSLTSWHIGGCAERFYSPPSINNLSDYLRLLPPECPITMLGLGSNVLIRDGGIKGAVIGTRQCQDIFQQADGSIVAQAGATCAKLARFCSQRGFPDAAFFAGIPGTVGGALAMNAGAFGGETWEWVQSVSTINREGECITHQPGEFEVGYRSVRPQKVFSSAEFRFPHQGGTDGLQKIRELLRKRAQSQPIGTFNCGSVYRNPPGDFAARLIEECKLKGARIGDAMISTKHANFIINCNKASAHDVETLMAMIESEVWQRFGIALQAEVKILGIGNNHG